MSQTRVHFIDSDFIDFIVSKSRNSNYGLHHNQSNFHQRPFFFPGASWSCQPDFWRATVFGSNSEEDSCHYNIVHAGAEVYHLHSGWRLYCEYISFVKRQKCWEVPGSGIGFPPFWFNSISDPLPPLPLLLWHPVRAGVDFRGLGLCVGQAATLCSHFGKLLVSYGSKLSPVA